MIDCKRKEYLPSQWVILFELGRGSGSRKIRNPGKSWSSVILNPETLNPRSFSNPESRKSQSRNFRIPEILETIPNFRTYYVKKKPWKSKVHFVSRYFQKKPFFFIVWWSLSTLQMYRAILWWVYSLKDEKSWWKTVLWQ